MSTPSPFLELGSLAALQNMRFSTRHRIEGTYSGRHTSRTLGGSGEFSDYREYTPGEDLRRLDWRVLGRTGRAYVKLFQDETNLVCTPVIDCSHSMQFGAKSNSDCSGSKMQYAQYFITALSHLVSYGRDQVGLALVGEKLNHYIAPGSTADHVYRLQTELANVAPEGIAKWKPAMDELFQRTGRRGVMLLISDFLSDDLESMFSSIRLFRHRGWEVIALHLVHPHEERLPTGSAWRFEGMEGEGSVNCSPAEIREIYEKQFAAHLTGVRTMALSAGCDYRLVSTAIPYLQTLSGFLVERTG
jgi:uncharacterized protein (DUF58 family)